MRHDGRGASRSVGTAPTRDRAGDPSTGRRFRLAVVPGVNPAKWLRVWQERLPDVPLVLVPVTAADAEDALRGHHADAALLRMPVDREVLSAIPLYTETTVVVVPVDHLVAAADEITAADLADDILLVPDDDVLPWRDRPGEPSALPTPATAADAVELVAAGVGVLAVPQSLARLHHRRDLTYRPVTDAPTSGVGLAWLTDGAPEPVGELVDELVGIVRGRTANSSRGRGAARRATDGGPATPAAGRGGTGRAAGSGTGGGGGGGTGRAGGGRRTGTGGRSAGGSGGRSGRGTGTGRSR